MKRKKSFKKRKKFFKRIKALIRIIVTIGIIILISKNINIIKGEKLYLQKDIYNYLSKKENRVEVFFNAVDLHDGKTSNSCVYFTAEVLRKVGVEVPATMCNVSRFIEFLESKGFKKDYDYKNLQPGDICFTTDSSGNKNGISTHTYIFMDWVEKGKYDYAYICDNQAKDYDDKIYHIRNINVTAEANGSAKDPFAFFMKP